MKCRARLAIAIGYMHDELTRGQSPQFTNTPYGLIEWPTPSCAIRATIQAAAIGFKVPRISKLTVRNKYPGMEPLEQEPSLANARVFRDHLIPRGPDPHIDPHFS